MNKEELTPAEIFLKEKGFNISIFRSKIKTQASTLPQLLEEYHKSQLSGRILVKEVLGKDLKEGMEVWDDETMMFCKLKNDIHGMKHLNIKLALAKFLIKQ